MPTLDQLTCRYTRIAAIVCASLALASACRAQRQAEPRRPEFWGFAAPWDPQSDASIRAHGRRLDAMVTGWIGLDSTTGRPLLPSPYADTIRPRGTERMAMVTSWHGHRFHTASIRSLARNSRERALTAGAIARYARATGYTGLVLDFETLEPGDLRAQLAVMKAISDSARAHGVRTIAAAVPASDTAAYPARPLLEVVDFIIPMLYDQHWSGSSPGPLSAPDWVRSSLAVRVREVAPDRIVVGLPTYGYQWRKGQPTRDLGFDDARRLAAQAGVPLRRDAAAGTLRAKTPDWELWVTDSHLLQRLVRDAQQAGVRRFAFWRMGREDPAMWGTVVP
jgi:peptidoglycan-N-acetylglucosamine deacetylase